jgi:predicted RNA-binding Zn ribbon-like protein
MKTPSMPFYRCCDLESTGKRYMLVSMKLSEKFAVPPELALLYDFLNTLDRRRFVEHGVAHSGGDELATTRGLESWMREHGLLRRGQDVNDGDHRAAVDLRNALRAFLEAAPEDRSRNSEAAHQLTAASRKFPLILAASGEGAVVLEPAPGSSALGSVLAQMIGLAEAGSLARLKTCASEECRWVFFDRSKPANRHWCSSARCGNRQKTRAYRRRQRGAA